MASGQSEYASEEEIPAGHHPPHPRSLQSHALTCVVRWMRLGQGGCDASDGRKEGRKDMIERCLKIMQSRNRTHAITLTFSVRASALGLSVSLVAFTDNHVIQMSFLPQEACYKPGHYIAYFANTNMSGQAEHFL